MYFHCDNIDFRRLKNFDEERGKRRHNREKGRKKKRQKCSHKIVNNNNCIRIHILLQEMKIIRTQIMPKYILRNQINM